MTIKDKENNTTWIEVKEIFHQCRPQRTKTKYGKDHHHPFFTMGIEDYDGNEYSLNFLPHHFIDWVDVETLKYLVDYLKEELDKKIYDYGTS